MKLQLGNEIFLQVLFLPEVQAESSAWQPALQEHNRLHGTKTKLTGLFFVFFLICFSRLVPLFFLMMMLFSLSPCCLARVLKSFRIVGLTVMLRPAQIIHANGNMLDRKMFSLREKRT